ncbi:MAG: hypothetical protein QM758_21980 [Armatimonas sp.]
MNPNPADTRYKIRYFWVWAGLFFCIAPFVIWFGHLVPDIKFYFWFFGLMTLIFSFYISWESDKTLLTDKKARIRARERDPISYSDPPAPGHPWTARVRKGAIAYVVVVAISLLVQKRYGHPTASQVLFDSLFLPLCWVLVPWAETHANIQGVRNFVADSRLTDEELVPEVVSEEDIAITSEEVHTLTRSSR